jgi:TorA maturation chaperone TorD
MDLHEMAQCRALAYRFLATLYLGQPDTAWLESLIRDDLLTEFPVPVGNPDMHEGLAKIRTACEGLMNGQITGAQLRADYDQLFVGPDHLPAPPWESVYRTEERLVFDWPAMEVRSEYRAMGLASVKPADPDDHLGLELLFMAIAAEREGQGDESARAAQRQFLRDHLSQWAPAFCSDVVAHAGTDLFKGLGLLTRGLLAQEETLLRG